MKPSIQLNTAERIKIANDTAEYIKRGGRITQIPFGYSKLAESDYVPPVSIAKTGDGEQFRVTRKQSMRRGASASYKFNDDDRNRWADMYTSGLSCAQISRATGASRCVIEREIRRRMLTRTPAEQVKLRQAMGAKP